MSQHFRSLGALAEILNQGAEKLTFSINSLRHLVKHGKRNGLAPHVRRVGQKIVIDEEGFNTWLNGLGNERPNQNHGGAS